MGFGYRLFTVGVAKGLAAYKPVELSGVGNKGATHYAKHAAKAIEAGFQGFKSLTGAPNSELRMRAGSLKRSTSTRRQKAYETTRGSVSSSTVQPAREPTSFGPSSTAESAATRRPSGLKPDDDDQIVGKATSPKPYRCLLMLPKTQASAGSSL